MDKQKYILTDCDGVLLDWVSGFLEFAKQKGHTVVDNHDEHWEVYKWMDVTPEVGSELIREFNLSSAMESLGPIKSAVHYVRLLNERYGYKFHVITSMNDDIRAQRLRRTNLERLFGPEVFGDLICLPSGSSKTNALSRYESTYWIEDNPDNAAAGTAAGHTSFLLKHKYNADHVFDCSTTVAESWEDIYNRIEKGHDE